MSKNVRHLFEGFQPEHYQLFIDPDRETRKVKGEVTITGRKSGRPSQRLTFHQHGLKITKATVTKHDKKGDQTFEITRINHQSSLDEVRLHAEHMLYPGQYTITLQYHGVITETNQGIYPCNYEIDGQHKALIATDLESHHAREVLPCIDEPEAKATFKLTLASPLHETALSNTPVEQQVEQDGKLHTTFEETPRMSTYLLCFAYGELQSRETKTKDGVEVRVWSTKAHSAESLDFSLDTAKRGIEFFNEYYGVPYPLKKCDLVGLPDFSAAAMENWGIITFREPFLVAEPSTSSQSSRELTALVINHELSHQWFGDLVTMKWWNDLWLNESFANVMEYLATDAAFPDWQVWNMFKAQEGLAAFRRDSIAGVQAIKAEVHHPDEINSLFDPSIVYAKGGRLIHSLMTYLGQDDFRKGLKLYFETHAYKNTTGDDLWAALSKASGKDVAAFMNPWLEYSGLPVVHVEQHGKTVSLTQAHFLLDPAKADAERLWPIPLRANGSGMPDLLETQHSAVELKSADFVRLNQDAIGHYVVHYVSPDHSTAIAESVSKKELNVPERLMLLSDSSMLARAGVQSFASTLELLQHYEAEDSQPVWDMIALVLADCRRFIDIDPGIEPSIKALVRKLIETQYKRLGWDEKPGESSEDIKLRATVLSLGIYGEHEAITKRALELFDAYKTDPAVVSSELRGIVFGSAIRSAHSGAFEYLLELDAKTTNVDLKSEIMDALTVTREEAKGDLLLGRLQDAKKVRQHDVDHWLVFLMRNRYTQAHAWSWFREHWDWIEKTFSRDISFDYYPRYAASAFSTRERMEEYKEFFEPLKRLAGLVRNIEMGVEELGNRVAWLERDVDAVKAFFKATNL